MFSCALAGDSFSVDSYSSVHLIDMTGVAFGVGNAHIFRAPGLASTFVEGSCHSICKLFCFSLVDRTFGVCLMIWFFSHLPSH